MNENGTVSLNLLSIFLKMACIVTGKYSWFKSRVWIEFKAKKSEKENYEEKGVKRW